MEVLVLVGDVLEVVVVVVDELCRAISAEIADATMPSGTEFEFSDGPFAFSR